MTPSLFFASEVVLVIVTTALIIKLSLPKQGLGEVASVAACRLLRDMRFNLLFFGLILVVMTAVLESEVDERITLALDKDFTASFYRVEGLFAASVQMLEHPVLTVVMAYFYTIVFPAMIAAAVTLFAFSGDLSGMFRLVVFIILNYIIAFPFYIFLPVKEVWVEYSPQVRPLMQHISPFVTEIFKYTNGINNCFPSLHVSLSLSVFAASLATPYMRYKTINMVSCGAIIFSTVYLGIHWMLDVIGGIALVFLINVVYSFVFGSQRVRIPGEKSQLPETASDNQG